MKLSNPFAFRPGQVTFWTTVVYLAIAIPLIWVHESVPPAPQDRSLRQGLNLTEAWLDLQTITTNYHPYNSRDNDRVRKYIIDRSKAILKRNDVHYKKESLPSSETAVNGSTAVTLFDDRVSNFTRVDENWRYSARRGTYFEGSNFYIYIRGTEDADGDWWAKDSSSSKAQKPGGVLVNCHFDSVSTGFGATDDGIGCVTMLQLLSFFTSSGRQPKNGIVLLFNDAEEDGLLGATAFGQSPLRGFVHTFVNLEGAGAGGRAILFRATDLEIAQAYSTTPHPFGSVVAADAFKRGLIKSGTDYEVFYDSFGQRGMDIAFYGPRARYHTDQDDARHASVDSVWHMLSAALASTEKLAHQSNTVFSGERSDGDGHKVQNGKPTQGVWFDMFGDAWVTMALRGLFAWSLTLLVATPLVLLIVTYLLKRKGKYYFFSRDVKIDSELHDDPVRLGGWKGFTRFPLALIFAGALTIASVLLVAKINPLIVYSSAYVVWAMTVSIFYFSLWMVMRGSSFVRPSALHRGFVLIWLFIIGWAIQVLATVAEDRWKVGSLYSTAFQQSAIFVALLIALLEMFALPAKRDFAELLNNANQAEDAATAEEHEGLHPGTQARPQGDGDEHEEGEAEPSETTPLVGGGNGRGQQTTFASTYRQSQSQPTSGSAIAYKAPYEREQSWSGHLPQWTWVIQLLLLAPVPVILFGNLALVSTSSLRMTGADGSSLMLPLLSIGVFTIFLLLPLSPFIHRVTHHVPMFLLLVFIGSLIYNLTAFPFSIESRFKFGWEQVIDLDKGTNVAHISGLEKFVKPIVNSIPSAAHQNVGCSTAGARAGLVKCEYDASALPPRLVEGKDVDELISVHIPKSKDNSTITVSIDALDSRMCVLDTSRPIFGFSVAGGSSDDNRLGTVPEEGFTGVDLWRRTWDGAWNVTLQLEKQTKSHEVASVEEVQSLLGSGDIDELRKRSDKLELTVSCKWSDGNEPSTIPALHELRQFMPSWAAVTKVQVGLVEVKKRYTIK
ncbi:putative zinc metalloprotease [Emericellopsis atlantica]|uniref:Peptide hydrolase n=1 Tax=Emericellopsis atlantica TaxID=2614577 RepID=A0A9P8CNB1_9HYPO|nr:putative zinc metalloprotease [Emericellopsis atlantica]KAG9252957.1 putative zinc metalloprotease [Emericellopsis atlantica]